MTNRDQDTLRVILYEGPGVQALAPTERHDVVSALLEAGYMVSCVREEIGAIRRAEGPSLVLARFIADATLTWAGFDSNGFVRKRDISAFASAAEVVAEVDKVRSESRAAQPGAWKPWFPVIDYDRCTQCMQCLSFCLFGVYGVDAERHIEVQNSEQCKTNCPACSRVCPEAAIIFPKYKAGPINGDMVSDLDLQREKMKIDISALLGGDIYQMLRDRSERARSRFSKERDSDKALHERQKCLQQLLASGDIPPEVLMSLPSPEEIQRRAQEAMERARAAGAKPGT